MAQQHVRKFPAIENKLRAQCGRKLGSGNY